MPVNLDALRRYHILNECFSNKHGKYTIEKLIEKCGDVLGKPVSERTVRGDIAIMRGDELGYNAPIEFNPNNKTYYYSESSFSIKNCTLNKQAINDISFALSILNEYKGFSFFESLENVFHNLEANIYAKTKEELPQYIEFEKHSDTNKYHFLKTLIDSILNQSVLKITYQRFVYDTSKEHNFHPYFLKEYQFRWYVIGLLDSKKTLITFALDRIQKVELLNNVKYIPNANIDFKQMFKNSIGISAPLGNPDEVILSFTPLTGKYFKTQPFCPVYEVLEDTDNQFVVKMHLHVNIELEKLILSNLGEVKVLSPQSLKDKLEAKAKIFLEN